MSKKNKGLLLFTAALAVHFSAFSQGTITKGELNGQMNYVPTAVPFLTIDPESRGGAMGDAGVATSPDVNSMHWNPAKYAFIKDDGGLAVSYSPWLRSLVPDIDLAYLAGYKRLKKDQVVAASLRYFSMGQIAFTDINGNPLSEGHPNEFAIDAAYSRIFGEHFSGALAFRYIRSDLAQGQMVDNTAINAGQSFAADVAAYYSKDVNLKDKKGTMAFGIDISNMGNKMTYNSSDQNKDFLPTNLRIGGSLTTYLDNYNSLMITTDFNKLLVPTPPVYYKDVSGTDSVDANGNKVVAFGKVSNVSVLTGMIQSFYDAPNGFKEELQEITYSIGMEYWYRKQFAIRAGYFHESASKGNRKFFTMGVGLKLNVVGFDFSYLMANSVDPLANTLRFSIVLDFNALRKLKNS